MPLLTCGKKSTMKHVSDDVVGVVLGRFEILIRVNDPGLE